MHRNSRIACTNAVGAEYTVSTWFSDGRILPQALTYHPAHISGQERLMGDYQTVTVDGSEMRCYVSLPSGVDTAPVMAVLHGGFGFDEVTQQAIDRQET